MELSQLIEFSWSAITGGVYYDALKSTLGSAFSMLEKFRKDDNKQSFEDSLKCIIETNEEIKNSLLAMAGGTYNLEVTTITTGNIEAGWNVVVGNGNTVGNSK
ncbi:hypothetical protein ACIL2W_000960 [Vibrio parahaemolyticus]|nr:hypothetical protein [Vibrio parahaemolyticus]